MQRQAPLQKREQAGPIQNVTLRTTAGFLSSQLLDAMQARGCAQVFQSFALLDRSCAGADACHDLATLDLQCLLALRHPVPPAMPYEGCVTALELSAERVLLIALLAATFECIKQGWVLSVPSPSFTPTGRSNFNHAHHQCSMSSVSDRIRDCCAHSAYCAGIRPKKRYHHMEMAAATSILSTTLCSAAQLTAMTAVPDATMLHGWHQAGLSAQTSVCKSLPPLLCTFSSACHVRAYESAEHVKACKIGGDLKHVHVIIAA